MNSFVDFLLGLLQGRQSSKLGGAESDCCYVRIEHLGAIGITSRSGIGFSELNDDPISIPGLPVEANYLLERRRLFLGQVVALECFFCFVEPGLDGGALIFRPLAKNKPGTDGTGTIVFLGA